MSDSPRATPFWLFGPARDLLLGCGLGYAALFAVYAAGGSALRQAQPAVLAALAAIVLGGPHYGATLLGVYERRSDRRAYAIVSLWATVVVVAWFVASLHSLLLGSLLLTLYITWSPWHYTDQNLAICEIFLRRRGVEVAPLARRLLHASFVASFLLTFLVLHGSNGAAGYVPDPVGYGVDSIEPLSLGIPSGWTRLLVPGAALGSLGLAAGALWRLARAASWRALGPPVALVASQALWFTLPFSVAFWGLHTGIDPLDLGVAGYYVFWVAAAHATQHLWITTYDARARPDWPGYGRYLAKSVGAGAAVWTLPAILFAAGHLGTVASAEKIMLLVASAVGVHHFLLDDAVWRLRRRRVSGAPARSERSAAEADVRGPAWRRGLVWTLCGASAAVACATLWVQIVAVPAAFVARDAGRVRLALDGLAHVGRESSALRTALGALSERDGDTEAATAQYERSLALRPSRAAWAGIARLRASQGDGDGALEAVDSERELGPLDFGTAQLAARILYARGERDRGGAALDQAAAAVHGAREYTHLGAFARELGDDERAVAYYRRALDIDPSLYPVANDLAWLLSHSEQAADPREAVRLAESAVVASGDDPNYLDTLAAAYAAAGRYGEAVRTAERAAELARAGGDEDMAREIEERLARYREHRSRRAPG